jgi:hypothetical protein
MEQLRPYAKDSRAASLDSPVNVLKLRGRMASPIRRAEA